MHMHVNPGFRGAGSAVAMSQHRRFSAGRATCALVSLVQTLKTSVDDVHNLEACLDHESPLTG